MKLLFFSLEEGQPGGVAAVNHSLREALEAEGVTTFRLFLRRVAPEGGTACREIPWSFTQGSEIKKALSALRLFRAARLLWRRHREKKAYREDLATARRIIARERPDAILVSHYLLLDGIPEEALPRTLHHVHTSYTQTMSERANRETLIRFRGRIGFLWLSRAICEKARAEGFPHSDFLYNPLSRYPESVSSAHTRSDVVIVSRFSPEKRLPLAVRLLREAFDQCPGPHRALFYGFGPEEEALREAVGDDPRFLLMGRTDDPFSALETARFTLNTSLFEGFSISVLEAAAAGVPTVAYRFGEAAEEEIQHGVTGLLVPMDDEAAMGKAILEALQDDGLVERLSREARRFSLRFEKAGIARELCALLGKLPLDKTEKES